ncbi:MAG: 1,4-alpha-glucan branching protein GlgB [Gammaproteobacteria bacterium]|nr:1,4-alpha-glucan branching protein GlgB [Gammaproteobacteria bacterium]MCP5137696.1 1,4-alpha-glucan branching protein GlgB [Gammaproteobacteria bacterium]
MSKSLSDNALQSIIEARHHDPFEVLGRHVRGDRAQVRVFLPHAREVYIADGDLPLTRIEGTDLFEGEFDADAIEPHYRLRWVDSQGFTHIGHDPYSFAPVVGELDLHLFAEGNHRHAYRFLGAHARRVDDIEGVQFAVWAPAAERVSVVGEFNRWDGRVHAMRVRGGSGVWELFIPGLTPGALYKFEIRNRESGRVMVKLDPYAQACQYRPDNANIVHQAEHRWQDKDWMAARAAGDWQHQPMSIYEVHLGSWKRHADGSFVGYRQLAEELVEYVRHEGFTHLELLPVTEHPLDASWGYQTTGYYAATSRFGSPDDFRWFVDHCHRNGIGVLLDWAPGHFPKDETALARFDGTALYEHADPRKGEHRDWGTYIFNYGRNEVRNFLVSSAFFWLEEFHIDGLRVDAVASMLYLDYSREAGDWVPNQYGGRENLEAIDFLREMNRVVHGEHPGAVVIAEESTAWPQVTRPDYLGGLGFSMKWNMGWMHDTLTYTSHDPVHRAYHHDRLTFGMMYAFTENFVLPFSHDEVVHLKGSMLGKMPGDAWQQFANLRLLYAYQWTYPGKKLLFMGSEFAQGKEWDFDGQLDWWQLDVGLHRGVFGLIRDLNRLYRDLPALHAHEFDGAGFEWIDCHDAGQSIVSYQRKDGDQRVVVVLNFTPVPRHDYRIGLPFGGEWKEILNTDADAYGGGNVGNNGAVRAESRAWMNQPFSAPLVVPPLAAVVLVPA